MANSCVSSLRFNSPLFSNTNPWPSSSEPSSLPLDSLLSRNSRKITIDQRKKNIRRGSVAKAIYSGGPHSRPAPRSSPHEIWSIREDLEIPSSRQSPSCGRGRQPPPEPPPISLETFHDSISQLFQYRIVRCAGSIEDDMANMIVCQLLYLDALDPNKDIVMYVNSQGGSVTAGMAIFDAMKHIRPDVSTVCVGLAASMGAFLLSAGTKGKRYSLPNARIMVHQPLSDIGGTLKEIEIQTAEVLHHKAVLNAYIAYHTGQRIRRVNEDTLTDFFMNPMEAKEYGLIDDVITNPLKLAQPPAPPLKSVV